MTHVKSVAGQKSYIRRNLGSLGKVATYRAYRLVEKSRGLK